MKKFYTINTEPFLALAQPQSFVFWLCPKIEKYKNPKMSLNIKKAVFYGKQKILQFLARKKQFLKKLA